MPIRGKEVRALRAAGHSLTPVLIIGRAGLSDEVIAAIQLELDTHELIKVKVGKGPMNRKEIAALLPERTGADVVNLLGRTILLYRKRSAPPPWIISDGDSEDMTSDSEEL